MVDKGESVVSGENDTIWTLERTQSQLGWLWLYIKVEGTCIVQSLEVQTNKAGWHHFTDQFFLLKN